MTTTFDQAYAQPNIVFILTDDQGPWAMGCAGNPEIRTPNLDRLAAEGVRFSNFFCTSPVCSPARASIMTGRLPSQHGVHDWIRGGNMPPDPVRYLEGQTCLTDLLAAGGYTCGLSGKWHLGDSLTPQASFSHWFAHQGGGGQYNNPPMVKDGKAVNLPGYVTDIITDDALAFLDGHRGETFYLSVCYTAPHSPWTGHPREIVDSYDGCAFASCPQEPVHPWAKEIGLTQNCLGNREMLKGYFAAVTAMDMNVGRILAKLDDLELTENTLVVFMSDNGFSCGHHGFWGKGNGTLPLNMYDNSVKVPMICRHPSRLTGGRVVDAMASQYDVLPTLLDYAGLPPAGAPAWRAGSRAGSESRPPTAGDARTVGRVSDPALPGVSLLPVLTGERDEAREEVVVYDEYGPVRMIRTREWKYVHRYPCGPHELYDLANDPDERKNLVEDEARAPLVAEMRRRLCNWFARYVTPERDGARFPVTGAGQRDRIGRCEPGESCFFGGRG